MKTLGGKGCYGSEKILKFQEKPVTEISFKINHKNFVKERNKLHFYPSAAKNVSLQREKFKFFKISIKISVDSKMLCIFSRAIPVKVLEIVHS